MAITLVLCLASRPADVLSGRYIFAIENVSRWLPERMRLKSTTSACCVNGSRPSLVLSHSRKRPPARQGESSQRPSILTAGAGPEDPHPVMAFPLIGRSGRRLLSGNMRNRKQINRSVRRKRSSRQLGCRAIGRVDGRAGIESSCIIGNPNCRRADRWRAVYLCIIALSPDARFCREVCLQCRFGWTSERACIACQVTARRGPYARRPASRQQWRSVQL